MTTENVSGQPGKGGALSYENMLLIVLCAMFGTLFWNRLALAYILPFVIEDLQITNTQAGLLVSILSLTWAISGFVIGGLSDRTGRRKWLLVVLTFGFSLSALLCGFAASFLALLVGRLAMGLAQGAVLPIAQTAMAMESTPSRRGFNMGMLQNLGSGLLANIIAPVAVVALAVAYGWREALLISAVPGFIFGVILIFAMKPDAPKPPVQEQAAGDFLKGRNVLLCLAATCLLVMWLMVQMTFLPVYMVGTLGFSSGEMATQLSIRGISGLVAGIALPGLSDRLGRKPVLIAGAVVAALSPLWVAMPGQTFTTMALSGVLMGAGAGCLPMVMAIIPSESVPRVAAATTMGLIMGVGELLGGFGAPVAAGFAADTLGQGAPFIMAGVAAILAAIVAFALKETAGKRIKGAAE